VGVAWTTREVLDLEDDLVIALRRKVAEALVERVPVQSEVVGKIECSSEGSEKCLFAADRCAIDGENRHLLHLDASGRTGLDSAVSPRPRLGQRRSTVIGMTLRRSLLVVGAVLFVVAGAVVLWIDWTGNHPHVDGVRVEFVARLVWCLGFVCLVIDDARRFRARRRTRRA
jgi:hypothetical protein